MEDDQAKIEEPGGTEGNAAAKVAVTPPRERLETRYLVYETSDMGQTLHLRGERLAGSSSQALTRHFADNPSAFDRIFTAVSENHLKLRVPPPKIEPPRAEG